MKHVAIALLTLSLLRWPASSQVPDAPAPPPDPAWSRLQSLATGQPVVITLIDGRSVHCLFAGVSDAYLFCNPPGNPAGVGFRFDHAEVIGIDLDLPNQRPQDQVSKHEHNYHPAWISSMIAGGIIVGLVASQKTDAGRAAEDGIIGAGIVGLIGAPMAFLPHPQFAPPDPARLPYIYGARVRIPVRRRMHR